MNQGQLHLRRPARLIDSFATPLCWPMLDDGLIVLVEELLDVGEYSQRQIARVTGVSRGMVWRVKTGLRQSRLEPGQPKAERLAKPPFSGPPQRCGCGRLVQMPCLACGSARLANLARRAPPLREGDGPDPLGLVFTDQAMERRYRQVRPFAEARRRAGQSLPDAFFDPDDLPT